jgi:hypothetical protein
MPDIMFGANHCRIEAKLMRLMEDAILELERAQSIPKGSPRKAHRTHLLKTRLVSSTEQHVQCSRQMIN